ncbi:hypothetical protein VKT23_016076 [Stygiomarasmius scandens]|uniref:DUF6593 domain-containing protein n=1 Tax=Marasmiellus scandens TaxID=2682957 RepID=A0ABR1IXZ7_9AGAR
MKLYQNEVHYNSILNNTYTDDSGRVIYKVHTPNLIGGTTTISKVHHPTDPEAADSSSISRAAAAVEYPQRLDTDSVSDEEYEMATIDAANEGSNPSTSDLRLRGRRDSGGSESRVSIEVDDETLIDTSPDTGLQSPGTPNQQEGSSDARSFPFEYIAQIDWKIFKGAKFRLGDGKEVLSKDFFRKDSWGRYGRHQVFTASDGVEYKWILGTRVPSLRTNDADKTPVACFHRRKLGIFSKSEPAYLEIYPAGEHLVNEIFITFIYIERTRKKKERAARSRGGP